MLSAEIFTLSFPNLPPLLPIFEWANLLGELWPIVAPPLPRLRFKPRLHLHHHPPCLWVKVMVSLCGIQRKLSRHAGTGRTRRARTPQRIASISIITALRELLLSQMVGRLAGLVGADLSRRMSLAGLPLGVRIVSRSQKRKKRKKKAIWYWRL